MAAILKSAQKGGGGPTYKALTSRLLISGVPWTKWYHSWRILGGGGGGARWPPWAHGLYMYMIDVDFEAFIPSNNFKNDASLFDLLDVRPGRLDKIAHFAHSSGETGNPKLMISRTQVFRIGLCTSRSIKYLMCGTSRASRWRHVSVSCTQEVSSAWTFVCVWMNEYFICKSPKLIYKIYNRIH